MLRVYLKKEVNERRAKAILEALGKPATYTLYEFLGAGQQFFQYGGNPLDVTDLPPKDVPEDTVERVTFQTSIARFFRDDGQYAYRNCKMTAEVIRAEKTGVPVQTIHVSGPSVGEVVEAYRAFRNHDTALGGKLQLPESWGSSDIGKW